MPVNFVFFWSNRDLDSFHEFWGLKDSILVKDFWTLSTKLRLFAQLVVLTQGYPKSVGGTFLLDPKGDLHGVKVYPPDNEEYFTFFLWLSVLFLSSNPIFS